MKRETATTGAHKNRESDNGVFGEFIDRDSAGGSSSTAENYALSDSKIAHNH